LPDTTIKEMKPERIRWAEHVASMGEMKSTYKILVRKLEGKILLGRLRRR
jgi:hypothetical protein